MQRHLVKPMNKIWIEHFLIPYVCPDAIKLILAYIPTDVPTIYHDGAMYYLSGNQWVRGRESESPTRINGVMATPQEVSAVRAIYGIAARYTHCSIVKSHNRVYKFGGDSSSLLIDPSSYIMTYTGDRWILINSLHTKRHLASCVAYNNLIYISGGLIDEYTTASSLEVFCPRTNTCLSLAQMRKTRMDHRMFAYHNRLYVVGGFTYTYFTHQLANVNYQEMYDLNTATWSKSDIAFPEVGSDLNIVVIDEVLYMQVGTDVKMYHPIYGWVDLPAPPEDTRMFCANEIDIV